MSELRIEYTLERLLYDGDNVGRDWTLYVNTGAGLVRLGSRIAVGTEAIEPRLLAVRRAPSTPVVQERWWASAIERDPGRPDRGAGLSTPVPIPIETGVEVRRWLHVEVVELPVGEHLGRLTFEVVARVVEAATPAPSPEAVPVDLDPQAPRPAQTAGELPEQFDAEARGISAVVPIIGRRRQMVDAASAGDDPIARALVEYLRWHTSPELPIGFTPQAALYELTTPTGEPFWIGGNSSMGHGSHVLLVAAFARAAPPLGSGSGPFEVETSWIRWSLGSRSTADLAPAAASLGQLVAALTDDHAAYTPVERALFVRSSVLDEFSGARTHVLFVDRTPFHGPEDRAWMVAWTDAWTE